MMCFLLLNPITIFLHGATLGDFGLIYLIFLVLVGFLLGT